MFLFKILFFTIVFGHKLFTTNGVILKCSGYFKTSGPCLLYIDITRDRFFAVADCVLPHRFPGKYGSICKNNKSYGKDTCLLNESYLKNINQTTIMKICSLYRVSCKCPTFLRFYTDKTVLRRNSFKYNEVKKSYRQSSFFK
ncbi:Hypothetical protein SRAE_X000051900 [Strongyloides ratti]|uniref:Uncharacterized protein n=1 Tax=Strongyloides ratti TaxID=34506 RepID=A0A090LSN6_STRRB|nr:Hypothetical protein SRAE_X000051900 [Strongyloides ratti]CEF71192.1 Hypothetical protein SRAE_X000051900 [Strongyloides ratti]